MSTDSKQQSIADLVEKLEDAAMALMGYNTGPKEQAEFEAAHQTLLEKFEGDLKEARLQSSASLLRHQLDVAQIAWAGPSTQASDAADVIERLCNGLENYRNTAPWGDDDEEMLVEAREVIAGLKEIPEQATGTGKTPEAVRDDLGARLEALARPASGEVEMLTRPIFGHWGRVDPWLQLFISKGNRLVKTLYNEPKDDIDASGTGDWIQTAAQLLLRMYCETRTLAQPAWHDPASAPKDGTLLCLQVEFESCNLEDHPFSQISIGHNCLNNTGVDEWAFAGWDWIHDRYTQGVGKVIGWMPLRDLADPRAVLSDETMRAIRTRALDEFGTGHAQGELWDQILMRETARTIQAAAKGGA